MGGTMASTSRTRPSHRFGDARSVRRAGPLGVSRAVGVWLATVATLCVVGAMTPVLADDTVAPEAAVPAAGASGARDGTATEPATSDASAPDASTGDAANGGGDSSAVDSAASTSGSAADEP